MYEFGSARYPERIDALSAGPSTLRLLECCGHLPHREQAGLVPDIVTQWLAASVPVD